MRFSKSERQNHRPPRYLAAIAFTAATLVSASALAEDVLLLLEQGPNHASDENREYLIDRNLGVDDAPPGRIDVGDSIRGYVNFNTINSLSANVGGLTSTNELTGVFQVLVVEKVPLGGALFSVTFAPDPDFESHICGGVADCTGPDFEPGPGAMVVFFEDADNDSAMDFDNPAPSTPIAGPDDGAAPRVVPPSDTDVSVGPYASEEALGRTNTDGGHFWTLGFTGPAGTPALGEGWVWLSEQGDNILNAFNFTSGTAGGSFNAGLTRLGANPGIADSVPISPVTASVFPLGSGVEFAASGQIRGVFDLDTPFEASSNLQLSFFVEDVPPPIGCRITGGAVSEDETTDGELFLVWDGKSYVEGEAIVTSEDVNRYQFGGQAGARTALSPQPWGEWQHHQQKGPAGAFSFHAGTRSAAAGTEIVEIRCSDPGGCGPSGNPPSPAKQLDFDCIGTFSNIGSGKKEPNFVKAGANATAEGHGNKAFDGTFHWCEVNIDDNGEGQDPAEGDPFACPADGFGEKGSVALANCDCPDFYRITIYDGVNAADVAFLEDGSIDPGSLNRVDVIYEVEGYLGLGGNGLQIHDLTGFDK